MVYGIFADLVVVLHFLFIAFMALGGLFGLRWSWFPFVHIPAALWGVALELGNWYCPLTPLEIGLRRKSGETGYEGSFVEQYVLPVIYPAELTREVQVVLALVLLGVNALVYGVLWGRRSRRRRT